MTVPDPSIDRGREKLAAFDANGFDFCCESCPLTYAEMLALASALKDTERERDAWKRSAQAEIADRAAAEEELAEIKRG